MSELQLSKLEMRVMGALWRLGRASVREILEAMPRSDHAYTTIQTILARLEDKGAVRRARKIGNAFVFEPTVSSTVVRRSLLRDILELFGGSGGARPLVAELIDTGALTLDDLRAIEREMRDEARSDTGRGRTRPQPKRRGGR